MQTPDFLEPDAVGSFAGRVIDCRFDLMSPGAGRADYEAGHIPGAAFLDLEEDLSAPRGEHGGRHPLPAPRQFAAQMAALGVEPGVSLLLYDDSRGVFAARLWWMLRALGFGPVALLAGGYSAWCEAGGKRTQEIPACSAAPVANVPDAWPLCCDREGLRKLQAGGAQLVDAREAIRYRGEQELIDPVAGHIPGADNRPWQGLTTDSGRLRDKAELREIWGELLDAETLVVYCGSGVSACLNLLSLSVLGRNDVWLYGGSWSDWCSYLPREGESPTGA